MCVYMMKHFPPPSILFLREREEKMTAAAALVWTLVLIMIMQARGSTGTACGNTCGSMEVKYPLGTGPGCGSPLFSPYVSCTSSNQLTLRTHTGTYPITSISYGTSTLTITPPSMSTCTSIHPSSTNFGLDLTSPFQLASSTFILLSCAQSSLLAPPLCDPSFAYLCASIYSCPSIVNLAMPLFPPTDTCCVYSPANLDAKGELDLRAPKCAGYASVVSLGDNPIDPTRWVYGVALKFSYGTLDSNYVTTKCSGCQNSGGVCGFAPPGNAFLCVCKGGYNTSLDCSSYNLNQENVWLSATSVSTTAGYAWSFILAATILSLV